MPEAQPPRVARTGEHEVCIPTKLLSLCPIAYTHSKGGPPLSPRSRYATDHLVRDNSKWNKAWWGTFIEVWAGFMEEVQKQGVDLATQL